MEIRRVTVDGEEFDVKTDVTDGTYNYNFDWVSGPNPDYGFGSTMSDGSPLPFEFQVESIRNFLAMIDPATGYIKDEDDED